MNGSTTAERKPRHHRRPSLTQARQLYAVVSRPLR